MDVGPTITMSQQGVLRIIFLVLLLMIASLGRANGATYCPTAVDGYEYTLRTEQYDVIFGGDFDGVSVSIDHNGNHVITCDLWKVNDSCSLTDTLYANNIAGISKYTFGFENSDVSFEMNLTALTSRYEGLYTFTWQFNGTAPDIVESCSVTIGSFVDECQQQPCENDGNCTDLDSGYKCDCLYGWDGFSCSAGDKNIYCRNDGYDLVLNGLQDQCEPVEITCYFTGDLPNPSLGPIASADAITTPNNPDVSSVPTINDTEITFEVCAKAGLAPGQYQFVHEIVSNGPDRVNTTFALTIIVNDGSNVAPVFNKNSYSLDVVDDTRVGEVLVYVNKSSSLTCSDTSTDLCIQVVDINTNPAYDIDTVNLMVNQVSNSLPCCPVEITFQSVVDDTSLGYFIVSGNLTAENSKKFRMTAMDGGQKSVSAEIEFSITGINTPPVCDTDPIFFDVDIRTSATSRPEFATINCTDTDITPKYRGITYNVIGEYGRYFFVKSDGTVELYQSLLATDPGPVSFNVSAAGYSANDDPAYTFIIPFSVDITVPVPDCLLTVESLPDTWTVSSVASLTLSCDIFGVDKLTLEDSTLEDLFIVTDTKKSSTVYELQLSVLKYERGDHNFSVTVSLGGQATEVSTPIPMFNPPRFLQQNYTTTIQDNSPISASVVQVLASSSAPVTFSIISVSPEEYKIFSIDDSGMIYLSSNITSSLINSTIQLTVQVKDPESNKTDVATVRITIMETNKAPTCSRLSSVQVRSDLAVGSVITTLNCTDPDVTPQFKRLNYGIISVDPISTQLKMGQSSEVLLARSLPLNYGSAQVTIEVSNEDPTFAVNVSFYISVISIVCRGEFNVQTGVTFPPTAVNTEATVSCPSGYSGQIKRFCFANETWGPFNDNGCRRKSLEDAEKQLDELLDNPSNVTAQQATDTLKEIARMLTDSLTTTPTLRPIDLDQIVEILSKMEEVSRKIPGTAVDSETVERLSEVVNSLLSADDSVWEEAREINNTEDGAMMMKAMDQLVGVSLHSIPDTTEPEPIVQENIAIKRATHLDDIIFPQVAEKNYQSHNRWVLESNDTAFLSKEAFSHLPYVVNYSVILYRNSNKKLRANPELQLSGLKGKEVNTNVMSFTLNANLEVLSPPLELTFSALQTNYSEPVCSYLDTSARHIGVWATSGCTRVKTFDGKVMCQCSHLTNFAILMSPYGSLLSSGDYEALSIISIIGCAISILCLVVTVIVYIVLWRYVKGDRSALHIHLCVILILAYVVFLAGVDKTDNDVACTVVAALLHLLFLIAFFIMLGEGIEILKSVAFVFFSNSILWKLLLFAYGVPIVIVAISLGVTQTEGYGNETSCWLSINDGLIWAFLGPVLLVLLINFIIIIHVLRTMQTSHQMRQKDEKQRIKSVVRTICVLSPLLGITWVFGVLSVNEETVVFQYLFAIFNSLQGLFIFIFHCILSHQVRDGVRAMRRKHKAQSFDSRQRMVPSSDSRGYSSSDSSSAWRNQTYTNSNGTVGTPVTHRSFNFDHLNNSGYGSNSNSHRHEAHELESSSISGSSGGRNRTTPVWRGQGPPEIRREGIPLDQAQIDGNQHPYPQNTPHALRQRQKQGFGASLKDKWRAFSRRRRSRRQENMQVEKDRITEIYGGDVDALRPENLKPVYEKRDRARKNWKKVQDFARSPQPMSELEMNQDTPFGRSYGTQRPYWPAGGAMSEGISFPPPQSHARNMAHNHLSVPEPDQDYECDSNI